MFNKHMQGLSWGLGQPILVRDLDRDLARTTPRVLGLSMLQLLVVIFWCWWQLFHILCGSIGTQDCAGGFSITLHLCFHAMMDK